jgi:hypothetical protein
VNLLKPGQSVLVSSQAGNNVAITVTVDVGDVHLGSAGAEVEGMFRPRAASRLGGLLPPTVCHQEIGPAIAIDITNPETMGISLPVFLLRAGCKWPTVSAAGVARAGKAKHPVGVEAELLSAIAVDIGVGG